MTKFIGGSSDGVDIAIMSKEAIIEVPVTDRRALWSVDWLRDRSITAPIKMEGYRLERIRGEKRTFEVYVRVGMPVDEMLYRIIEGYRSPKVASGNGREQFEALVSKESLPVARHTNSDGSEGQYKNPVVHLAWKSWVESRLWMGS